MPARWQLVDLFDFAKLDQLGTGDAVMQELAAWVHIGLSLIHI